MKIKLPEQEYFSVQDLSRRWGAPEDHILHLAATGKLPIADLYAARQGKRHTVFKASGLVMGPDTKQFVQSIMDEYESIYGKEPEPSDDDLVIEVYIPEACYGEDFDYRMDKGRQQYPEADVMVFLLADVLHFEVLHSSSADKKQSASITITSLRRQPTTNPSQPRDRLGKAMVQGYAAYKKIHGHPPTADTLFEWLPNHDDTDIIDSMEPDGEHLWWIMGNGNMKKKSRTGFGNRFTSIKKLFPEDS